MYDSMTGLAFLATMIVLLLFIISLSLYLTNKQKGNLKPKAPWLSMVLYFLCIMIDWYYANETQQLSGDIAYAWFYVFPLFIYFYLTFSAIAISGIYHRKKWGYGLAYTTILAGWIAYANTALIVYSQFPLMEQFFTLISILNIIVIVYLSVYCIWNKLDSD